MKKKGFSLMELIISMVAIGVVVGGIIGIFLRHQRYQKYLEALTQAQESGRIGIEILSRDLKQMGAGIDVENQQLMIAYAGPYEVIFNANLTPYPDDPTNPGYPKALNPSLSPSSAGPHYAPGRQYETGAETIRYTLDINDDGEVNEEDKNASSLSRSTRNPNDYVLVRRVYGELADGTNGGTTEPLILVKGPDRYPDQTDTTVQPIFQYWWDDDNDPSTPPVLWGDVDGDGKLSGDEIRNLTPITDARTLQRIKRITVFLILEPVRPDPRGNYHEVVLQTDVAPGNVPKPVRTITGHVYQDLDEDGEYDVGEPGISDWTVWLSSGDMTVTNAWGIYTFAVPAGNYTIITQPKTGWLNTTSLTKEVCAETGDVDLTTDVVFGFKPWPTGWVEGYVFLNNTPLTPCSFDPDSGDLPIAYAKVTGDDFSGRTDTLGFYRIEVNADIQHRISVDTLSGVCIITEPSPGVTYDTIPGELNAILFTVEENDTARISFSRQEATGIPCTLKIVRPEGGEIWALGSDEWVKWYADGIDDSIIKAYYYYSSDAGVTWEYIDWSDRDYLRGRDSLLWSIPDTLAPTRRAVARIIAYDQGGNMCYDESDLFTIAPPHGFVRFYFRRNDAFDTIPPGIDTVKTTQCGGVTNCEHWARYMDIEPDADTFGIAEVHLELEGEQPLDTLIRYMFPGSTYAEWITKPGLPYADTIFPGVWKFYFYALSTVSSEISTSGGGSGRGGEVALGPTPGPPGGGGGGGGGGEPPGGGGGEPPGGGGDGPPGGGASQVTPQIRIEVSRRDSLGSPESDTTLIWYKLPANPSSEEGAYYAYDFSTRSAVRCSILHDDTLTDELTIDTIWIKVPVGFPMDRSHRLYIKVFLDTRSYGHTGFEQYSYIYYNSTESPNAPSWFELPPAP